MPSVDDAERALELADEAAARFDVDGVVAHLSTAIRVLTAADEPCRAAMVCVRLGEVFAYGLGNLTAARAWFARAARLVEDRPPCIEQGWVAVAAMGCDVDDPAALLAAAELALDRARTFGDVNLETKALADAGLAHVQAGRVEAGMALLDEAMALACGPADDASTASKSVCSFFTACYYAGDFARAESWADLLRRNGLIGPAPGGQVFLSGHCDLVQATLLVELGRWGEAEALLLKAKADFDAVMPGPGLHPEIGLANLRIRQGRLADAEALLLGRDQPMEGFIPTARLHLARGDHDLARATAQRGLRLVADDRLRAAELLNVLVDAELARGDVAAAVARADDLADRVAGLDVPALEARSAAARARAQAATGDHNDAVATLEKAFDRLDRSQLPWLRACLLVDLARLREAGGDRSGASVDAEAAAAALASLDVVLAPPDRELLARLTGAGRRAVAGEPRTARLTADGDRWVVSLDGARLRLPNTKGVRYLAELLARPGRERHALDLVDQVEGVDPDGLDRRSLGGAGPVLDAQARDAYRRRIAELREHADEALATGRLEDAEAAQDEVDQLLGQLAQAFGLGGRDRPAASAVERARLNVTRALRTAIAKVTDALPEAGAVLDRRVRTGIYCCFDPDPGDEVRWSAAPRSFSPD